jgi:hypothetical protein
MELEQRKQRCTAEELATILQLDLKQLKDCPGAGVQVLVYGIPWKALLMFGAEAGPVRNRAELQHYFAALVERLQRLYDVE